jgi:alpha-galactosidase
MHRVFLLAFALLLSPVGAIDNGLALTPPLGWRSWYLFMSTPTQHRFMPIIEGMVNRSRLVDGKPTSLLDLGYKDVGLDNGWENCTGYNNNKTKFVYHNDSGYPMVDQHRFPSMSNMTAHAHSLNLTMSWYGNNCMRPEKLAPPEMYKGDVAATLDFGWDGIKLDSCGAEEDLNLFEQLFNATGKPFEQLHQLTTGHGGYIIYIAPLSTPVLCRFPFPPFFLRMSLLKLG